MTAEQIEALKKKSITANDLHDAGWNGAINQVLKKLNETQWISVKDRLPESDELVLTYSEEISGHRFRLIVPNIHLSAFPSSVTHWMPLPKPPNKDPK